MMEYSIPDLVRLGGLNGYSPQLSSAINTLISTSSEIEYKKALKNATAQVSGYTLSSPSTGIEIDGYDAAVIEDHSEMYSDKSHFGLPIYMPLLFEKLNTGSEDYILESAVLKISRSKEIVVTKVQGRDSTIKEFISNGDWEVSVTGLIANKGVGYPKREVKQFAEYLKAKRPLKIIHEKLNMLGIHELVITAYDLPESDFMNIQPYSFTALSETAIELRIDQR